MENDLDYSQTRSFNLGIAQATSIEAAIIYDDLVYAQKVFGRGYFFRSYEQMMRRFPMLSERTIRRHVNKLEAGGWISTKIMKVNGKPTVHYQVGKLVSAKLTDSVSAKMTDSMVSAKMTDSINLTTKETTKSKNDINLFLSELLLLVNKKEKATDYRRRALAARLKDYTPEEITAAAVTFSKSEWHRENHQMSIDNLLAPSKFGRWYALADTRPVVSEAAKQRRIEHEDAEAAAFRAGEDMEKWRKEHPYRD